MFRITCQFGYSLIGERPCKIQKASPYLLIGESVYFPECYLMESAGSTCPERVIVPKASVQEISEIKFDKEAASSCAERNSP